MDKVMCESSLFKCPLCNDLIHLATVINECLHRFCKLCITNYFEKNYQKTCPVCQIILINPLETLKSDLTFQRLVYKIFHHKIACQLSFPIDTKINLCLESLVFASSSSDFFQKKSSKCYLECSINIPLLSIEKFLRIKYSILSELKIEFFYQSFLLDTNNERLIDIYYSFDMINKNVILNLHFIVSRNRHQSNLLKIQKTSSINTSTLKLKICRSQNSTNNWFISQSKSSNELSKKIKLPRRRIRFLPTMVNTPPSIFDYLSNKKTICKILPYIPENSFPLDLSLK